MEYLGVLNIDKIYIVISTLLKGIARQYNCSTWIGITYS